MTSAGYAVATAVPMRDGIVLAADLYLPRELPAPTLLLRTPYDRGALDERLSEVDPVQATLRGFAVVIQDVRGRGGSHGRFRPLVVDGDDAVDTIAWLRAQRWSDGRLAMVGRSFSGVVQFLAASARPEGLLALSPAMSGSLRQIWYPGGAMRLTGLVDWATRLVSERLDRGGDQSSSPELLEFMDASPIERLHAAISPGGAVHRCTEPIRDWLAPRSKEVWMPSERPSSCGLPAIYSTGWYDICQFATLDAYAASSRTPAPQALIVGPWSHDLSAIDDQGLGSSDTPWTEALEHQLTFLDAVMHARELDRDSLVRSFALGGGRWSTFRSWPPPGARPQRLFLAIDGNGAGRLRAVPSAEVVSASYRYDPRDPVPTLAAASCLPGVSGANDGAALSRRDVLVFTSDPFLEPTELVGPVAAILFVSSDAPATDFVARLDLVRGGRTLALATGYWSGRLADLELVHGSARRCEIEAGAIHVAARAGDRLCLYLTSSDYPEIYPNPNTGWVPAEGPPSQQRVASQTVLTGGALSASLSFRVLEASGAR